MLSGRTDTVTITSPLGPPFIPASPWPRSAMLWSSLMPAGIFTSSVERCAVLPVPWQALQGFLMICPLPPQRWQGCWVCITPNGVRCWRTTKPRPPQSGQVSGLVPFSAPLPPHFSHGFWRLSWIFFTQPCTASLNSSVMLTRRSRPLRGALGLERLVLPPKPPKPPPNRSPKMSPRSTPPAPKPPKPPAPWPAP